MKVLVLGLHRRPSGKCASAGRTYCLRTLRPAGAPLLSYIYTSGTWVHGDSRTEVFTDTTPVLHSVDIVAWRPAIEQLVLRSTKINGIVVRSAVLYGRTATIFGLLFKSAAEGKFICPGTPGGRYALVHTDDLADLYVRMAEKASLLGGKILLGATGASFLCALSSPSCSLMRRPMLTP
ncbi:NAD(P)-binding protein [Mycena sanguinolenta]|uniref:NAD(P)-binding protein n=1 Tax=Mycena sanguinolenta TaxID=230812 RepID=A0A8H6Z220_9AGAR|nr:NAD(P)-binding protein [Mycena sanguinolenta]